MYFGPPKPCNLDTARCEWKKLSADGNANVCWKDYGKLQSALLLDKTKERRK